MQALWRFIGPTQEATKCSEASRAWLTEVKFSILKEYGGLRVSELRRLRQLETENGKLK